MSNTLQHWLAEQAAAFHGWDFSRLDGRWHNEATPWDYRDVVKQYLTPDTTLLDMGTGGGEILLSLNHPPQQTAVTEGYEPNYQLCLQTLAPQGIEVQRAYDDDHLPFADGRFTLVLNRHSTFDAHEVNRVLTPGGVFITQQVGCENDLQLGEALFDGYQPHFPHHTLAHNAALLTQAGFELLTQAEAFPLTTFYDTGAVVYYTKIIEWEFPNFSVDACYDKLCAIDRTIATKGCFTVPEHRFILVARKNNTKARRNTFLRTLYYGCLCYCFFCTGIQISHTP